jgi:hypothetical protein
MSQIDTVSSVLRRLGCVVTLTGLLALSAAVLAAEPGKPAAAHQPLFVGWASADITPPRPVNLVGQMGKRISQGVDDPVTATVLALETKGPDGKAAEQALLISMDTCGVHMVVQDRLKELVKGKLADFNADKLFLNATHTHTAPMQIDGFVPAYEITKEEQARGVMTGTEYATFLCERLTDAAVRAWSGRQPGGLSWALGHAVVGHNRRATYLDGHAQMYGDTNRPEFDRIEGYEDHSLPLLFCWDAKQQLTGIVVNVACPSQETEGQSKISADFWHEVRVELRKRYSPDLFVLPQCSAAGDISPHLLWQQQAEQTMLQRKGVSRRQEIALRIADGVDRVFPFARKDVQTALVFKHTVARVNLPPQDPPKKPFYETDPVTPLEFHVLRLGDVALATNPFELYLDYGLRMKARSPAALTLLVQLSCRSCGYLPTAQAVRGGSYSADRYIVGPDGGQVLVEETLRRFNALWEVGR